ncbi:hypothetical protein VTO42DRAFT_7173 [Malbranchea cinnamomea]
MGNTLTPEDIPVGHFRTTALPVAGIGTFNDDDDDDVDCDGRPLGQISGKTISLALARTAITDFQAKITSVGTIKPSTIDPTTATHASAMSPEVIRFDATPTVTLTSSSTVVSTLTLASATPISDVGIRLVPSASYLSENLTEVNPTSLDASFFTIDSIEDDISLPTDLCEENIGISVSVSESVDHSSRSFSTDTLTVLRLDGEASLPTVTGTGVISTPMSIAVESMTKSSSPCAATLSATDFTDLEGKTSIDQRIEGSHTGVLSVEPATSNRTTSFIAPEWTSTVIVVVGPHSTTTASNTSVENATATAILPVTSISTHISAGLVFMAWIGFITLVIAAAL